MEPMYLLPASLGWSFPAQVQEAARAAALLEIEWRLQDYVGRPMYPSQDTHMQWQAKAVLGRYLDILGDYWWAVYSDRVTTSIVVSIVTDEDYRKQPDLAVLSRYRRVSDASN